LVENGNAYVAEGHVLFHVPSMPDYGRLSGRTLDEMVAGARVEVAPYKRDPMDFVLWKPSKPGEPAWPAPAGIAAPGRPGWHIECSAMSEVFLGKVFDIHGGGIDLVFPHHENELAQSRCVHGTDRMAQIWMHNGYLQVEGAKMSKSAGNFVTVRELLGTTNFGGRKWHGEVIRLAILMTHYRQPMDWTAARLLEARNKLDRWYKLLSGGGEPTSVIEDERAASALTDDLDTWGAITVLDDLHDQIKVTGGPVSLELKKKFKATGRLLGLLNYNSIDEWVAADPQRRVVPQDRMNQLISARAEARKRKDWAEADRIRDELAEMGISLKDNPDGTTTPELIR
ncbi:MAG TPA: cysteine--tRNA ligase, partial [Afifellaceae bacterium]|nr:cysteine--tRNA ligase [Afifellaceae bacterium]